MGAAHPYPLQLFELAEIALDDQGTDEDCMIDFIHDQASAARQLLNKGDIPAARAALLAIHRSIDDALLSE
jgi:hypothetical protein